MRLILAILLGKLIIFLSRNFRIGGGSAAPGLYALKICPDLVSDLSKRIPKNVVITGTNGKTTTARLLAHFAQQTGLKIIRNHTGSNLERGIASTLIQNSCLNLKGYRTNYDLGIWELDEAAFNWVAPKLKPDIVVFLNIFRDQLDRYGEIDSVIKQWSRTLTSLTSQTVVLVNGDDSNTAKLAKSFAGKTYMFGVKDYKIAGESLEHKKENENLDFEAKNVKVNKLNRSTFELLTKRRDRQKLSRISVMTRVPGVYNIYNTLAAIACGDFLEIPQPLVIKSLKDYSPAFGRVEKLDFGYIFLIKNPAGATQVFQTLAPNIKPQDRLLLALNDNIADGRDISWIWDAQFEALFEPSHPQISAGVNISRASLLLMQNVNPPQGWTSIICSGTRAEDLAVRLQYAGFKINTSDVKSNLENAFRQARKDLKGRLFILLTYTAMLELQSILTRSGLKKHYWQEE